MLDSRSTFLVTEEEVPSTDKHPSAAKKWVKERLKLPDYSIRNSLANIKKYIYEQAMAKTTNGIILIKL